MYLIYVRKLPINDHLHVFAEHSVAHSYIYKTKIETFKR